jgi:hypothetical protein
MPISQYFHNPHFSPTGILGEEKNAGNLLIYNIPGKTVHVTSGTIGFIFLFFAVEEFYAWHVVSMLQ